MGIPPEVGLEMTLFMHQVTFQTRMFQVWGQLTQPPGIKQTAGLDEPVTETDILLGGLGKVPEIIRLEESVTAGSHPAIDPQHQGIPEVVARPE